MQKEIVPFGQRRQRFTVQGKVRLGEQVPTRAGDKMKPVASRVFIFTSPVREVIEQCAMLYGGEVAPFNPGDGRKEWKVKSTTDRMQVRLVPSGFYQTYEQWLKKVRVRTCDGERVEVPETVTIDGYKQTQFMVYDCICRAEQARRCEPKLRLQLILPDIVPMGGIWQMDTGSWLAADELPLQFDAICRLQEENPFPWAWLRIDSRQAMDFTDGRHDFIVPVLESPVSMRMMEDGGVGLALLAGPSQQRALVAPLVEDPDDVGFDAPGELSGGDVEERHEEPAVETTTASPDEIEEAELVEEHQADEDGARRARLVAWFMGSYGKQGDQIRKAAARRVSRRRTDSFRELTHAELLALDGLASELRDELSQAVITENGVVFRAIEGPEMETS